MLFHVVLLFKINLLGGQIKNTSCKDSLPYAALIDQK